MDRLKASVVFATPAASMAAMIASGTAQAQTRDCVIVGNIAPIEFNSQGTIEVNSGETCKMPCQHI
jgi:hypothetical protein